MYLLPSTGCSVQILNEGIQYDVQQVTSFLPNSRLIQYVFLTCMAFNYFFFFLHLKILTAISPEENLGHLVPPPPPPTTAIIEQGSKIWQGNI